MNKFTHRYETSCVSSDADSINTMKARAKKISRVKMGRDCDLKNWALDMGYEADSRRGLTLAKDWHVGYFESTYRGVPCFFLAHSRIEHIWVPEHAEVPDEQPLEVSPEAALSMYHALCTIRDAIKAADTRDVLDLSKLLGLAQGAIDDARYGVEASPVQAVGA